MINKLPKKRNKLVKFIKSIRNNDVIEMKKIRSKNAKKNKKMQKDIKKSNVWAMKKIDEINSDVYMIQREIEKLATKIDKLGFHERNYHAYTSCIEPVIHYLLQMKNGSRNVQGQIKYYFDVVHGVIDWRKIL